MVSTLNVYLNAEITYTQKVEVPYTTEPNLN